MATYLIFNAILTGLLTLAWNTKGLPNVTIKTLLASTTLVSAFYAMQMLGYIVKA